MALPTAEELQALAIFMPWAAERIDNLLAPNSKLNLAYYTSAETALSIISRKEVWMRDVRCMNDFLEVQHGIEHLRRVMSDSAKRSAFASAIDCCCPGASSEVFHLFSKCIPFIERETYITCMCEHDPEQFRFGRLSMWRAYSRNSPGVAMVLNVKAVIGDDNAVPVPVTPVGYFEEHEFDEQFQKVTNSLRERANQISTMDRNKVITYILRTLWFAAVATKHPGFKEEAEWRIVHSPTLSPVEVLEKTAETVCRGGVPQKVYKLPLGNKNGGVDIARLIYKIIVGPSDFSNTIKETLVSALEATGIRDAESRVVTSDIPLRANQ